jgi:hypothetical protein
LVLLKPASSTHKRISQLGWKIAQQKENNCSNHQQQKDSNSKIQHDQWHSPGPGRGTDDDVVAIANGAAGVKLPIVQGERKVGRQLLLGRGDPLVDVLLLLLLLLWLLLGVVTPRAFRDARGGTIPVTIRLLIPPPIIILGRHHQGRRRWGDNWKRRRLKGATRTLIEANNI